MKTKKANCVEIIHESGAMYNANSDIKFKNSVSGQI